MTKASPPDKADRPCRHDSGIPYRHHEQGDRNTFLELSFYGTPGRRHLSASHACCFLAGPSHADWAVFSMAGSTIAAITAALAKFPFDPLFIGLAVSFLLILPGLRLKKLSKLIFHVKHL